MKNKVIPTAEELIDKIDEDFYAKHSYYLSISSPVLFAKTVAIEFTKLHVEAALKEASENATVTPIDHEEISEGSFRPIWGVDDDSILNSYPLNNIK